MAWRLHEYVRRGEIDNRQRGLVTGRIWLDGVAEPLELALSGDGHPGFPASRLAHYRAELFQIREAILAIISRLRKDI